MENEVDHAGGTQDRPWAAGSGFGSLFPSPDSSLLLPYALKVIMGSWLPPAPCKIGQVLLLPVSKLFSINLASQGTSKRKKYQLS